MKNSINKKRSNILKLAMLFPVLLLAGGVLVLSNQISNRSFDPTRSEAAARCTIYASPNGRESNNGSSTSSPLTLDEANKKTVPGSVVCLMDGTYLLTRPLYIVNSGTSSAWITYRAQNVGRATIKWNTRENDDMFQITKGTPGTRYIEISDLIFDGGMNGTNTAKNAVHGHVGTHHIRVLNNTMTNLKGSAIGMGSSDYNWIIGNRIHHIGNYTGDREDGWGSGITFNANVWFDRYSGFHSYVIGNVISGVVDGSSHNSDGNGIIMDKSNNDTGTTPPVLILNNVIYQNGGRCIHNLEVTNIWVVNNTCYGNSLDSRVAQTGSVGEYTFQKAKNNYMVNNLVLAWTKGYTLMHSPETQNIKYYNNIIFGGKGAAGVISSITGDAKQVRNINPQFTNAPSLDGNADGQYGKALNVLSLTNHFYLKPTSPAVDTGIDPTTLTSDENLKRDLARYIYKDYEGKARPQGRGIDIGAYELQTASTSPIPTDPGGILGVRGSTIVIHAASTPIKGVYASMDLYINNNKAASWTNVRGDVAKRTFVTFTHRTTDTLEPSDISVRFVNDADDDREDRNLYIDKMVLNGVTYQTEASSTYSTGTYTQGVGCIPGHPKSEVLHCEGYVRF